VGFGYLIATGISEIGRARPIENLWTNNSRLQANELKALVSVHNYWIRPAVEYKICGPVL
jgi:hypothetical protein